MPYHRTQPTAPAASSPRIAQLADSSAGGMADSRFATDEANPGCPVRGGRVLSQVRMGSLVFVAHTAKQQNGPGLSNDTESGQSRVSRLENACAGASIVAIMLAVLLVLSGGWPLTLLFGGAS